MQQRRHGDVVRQIRDHGGGRLDEVGALDPEDVAVQNGEPVDLAVRVLSNSLRQALGQHGGVDLDRTHGRPPAVQQRQSQGTQAGADFQDMVVLIDPGGGDNTAHGICVVHEILAQRFTRLEVEFFGEISDLGSPKQTNCHDAPPLPHTGHAPPQPCRDLVTSAIAICSSLVARSARSA